MALTTPIEVTTISWSSQPMTEGPQCHPFDSLAAGELTSTIYRRYPLQYSELPTSLASSFVSASSRSFSHHEIEQDSAGQMRIEGRDFLRKLAKRPEAKKDWRDWIFEKTGIYIYKFGEAALAAGGVVFGCGSDGDDGPGCIPGESIRCACPRDEEGVQVCQPDHTFSSCECDCHSHESMVCHGGDVYWENSCGDLEERYQDCTSTQTCHDGECVDEEPVCIPHSHADKVCHNGDVYWRDSCGDLEERYQDCTSTQTCRDGECVDEEPVCIPHSHADKVCHNGDVYWRNSCGDLEERYQDCTADQHCENGECVDIRLWLEVSAGRLHTCGVLADGIVECWGENGESQSSPPPGDFFQVSAGGAHTCGVRTDETVACWGDDSYNQSSPPSETFSQVSAGDNHTCGVRTDETVACWGSDFHDQSSPPPGDFFQVSAGGAHTCGVRTDETVACWGFDFYNQSSPPSGAFSKSARVRFTPAA